MNRRALLAMVASLLVLFGCTQVFQASLTGRWEGTARLNFIYVKPCQIVLMLVETNGVLTGTLEYIHDYGSELVEITGTHSGRNVEIRLVLYGLEMVLEGLVDRRTIAGTCTWRGVTDAWEVSRVS